MENGNIHAVTGAFGYSGKYIARRLLKEGIKVRTLTNSGNRTNDFQGNIEVFPYNFDDPKGLCDSLKGVSVLYNTYWVRFNHTDFKHSLAVENTFKLFDAAKKAGVKRVVHVSITNPSLDSTLEYFRGKAKLEKGLIESGMTYAILRPTVLFGKEDILINNIAWTLRKLPVYGLFGDGNYQLQPIYVEDMANLAVEEGRKNDNKIINAIGPETFTYKDLVKKISCAIGVNKPIVPLPDSVCWYIANIAGRILGDVIVTKEEIEGLKANLLYTNSLPAGETKLTEWIKNNASSLGIRYSSELARRKNRKAAYDSL